MTPELYIAILGLVVAVAAAVYANRSADAAEDAAVSATRSACSAERANDIDLHKSQLEIYRAFQGFHGAVVTRGPLLADVDVFSFLSTAHLAEFYFPSTLHQRLEQIGESALIYLNKTEEWRNADSLPEGFTRPERTNLRALMNAQHKILRDQCAEADPLMRDQLRLFRQDQTLQSSGTN